MVSRTVSACAGLKADTVPAIFLVCRILVDVPLFFNNSDSIFLRIAYGETMRLVYHYMI
jgi:hypothetical protein